MIRLKKLFNRIGDIFWVIVFLLAIYTLPSWIVKERPFGIGLNISIFFFFWDHFFWHRIQLGNLIWGE